MILYATEQTFERFKLKTPEEMKSPMIGALASRLIKEEQDDSLLKWGMKLFYFDRRKCIQTVNFASKLTLFLIDIKLDDTPEIADYMARYLMFIYKEEPAVVKRLERLYKEYPVAAFARLKDKSMIATLNHTQLYYLRNGYRLFDYVENGVLQTRKINRDVNREWPFTEKRNGKTTYYYSAEKFKTALLDRYPTV